MEVLVILTGVFTQTVSGTVKLDVTESGAEHGQRSVFTKLVLDSVNETFPIVSGANRPRFIQCQVYGEEA